MVLLPRYSCMNLKNRTFAIAIILSFSPSAWAQSQEPPRSGSMIESLIWSLLPFIAIAAFIWFFFVKAFRKMQDKAVDAQRQHNANMENLLERIAKALEKKDGGSV